ncbi:MAG: hypothetical protein Q7R90_05210 [bacterium]|nr:hypothetical protein [bacterium]
MAYVRKEADKVVILPPQDTDTAEYLREVHRELDGVIAKGKPGAMHRIDLDSGMRGGYFINSNQAVTELLTEFVDASRSTASKKHLTA